MAEEELSYSPNAILPLFQWKKSTLVLIMASLVLLYFLTMTFLILSLWHMRISTRKSAKRYVL
jgi:Tfp pilus assembly protein PilX